LTVDVDLQVQQSTTLSTFNVGRAFDFPSARATRSGLLFQYIKVVAEI